MARASVASPGDRPAHANSEAHEKQQGLLHSFIQFVPPSNSYPAHASKKRPAVGETAMQENNKRRRLTDCLSRTMPVSDRPKDSRVTLGLHNPGNFCYRRSVLQSIMSVPIVVNWLILRAESHRQDLQSPINDTRHNCLFCAVANLAEDIWVRRKITSLHSFDQRLRELDPHKMLDWPRSHRQADAHEFLHVLIDHIVDPKHGFNNPAPIAQGLFSMRISRQWTCKSCHLVHTASPIDETGLNLAIANPKNGNVDDYIRQYFQPEQVEARCENEQCPSNPARAAKGQKSPVLPLRWRSASISSTPEVLFVQFNRFALKYSNGRHSLPRKERKRVPYSQHLDLSQHVTADSWQDELSASSLRYKLTAVVAHQGEKNSGHYIAFVKSPNGAIHEISDASVRTSTLGEMLNPSSGFTPYILTYVRVGNDDDKERSTTIMAEDPTSDGQHFRVSTNGIPFKKTAASMLYIGKHTARNQASLSPSPGALARLTLRGSSSEEEEDIGLAKASIDFIRRGGQHGHGTKPVIQKPVLHVQRPAWFSQGRKSKFKHGKTFSRRK